MLFIQLLTLVIHRDTPLRSGGGGAGPVRPCSYSCLRALTAIAAKPHGNEIQRQLWRDLEIAREVQRNNDASPRRKWIGESCILCFLLSK